MYRTTCPEAVITIRNFGENPVNQLFIRSSGATKVVSNLDILPGEEFGIAWPEFYFNTNEYPAGQNYDLCAWTSHPNLLFDADASNDTYCTSFLVNNKEVLVQNYLSLFPNPTAEVLNVQINGFEPLTNTSYRIVSADGRVVKFGMAVQATFPFEIPVRDWAPGMYLLQLLEDEAVIGSARFVVVK